jgi:orotidine-5'-phosphate decarboxylase
MQTQIFCAIDTGDLAQAETMAQSLAGTPCHIKLGLEFFTAQGVTGVEKIRGRIGADTKIFLDLKFHDIPNTVAGAVRSALQCRPDFITLHASGGKTMMQAAQAAVTDESRRRGIQPAQLLAVTVLTTLDDADLAEIGQPIPAVGQVVRLAKLAQESGIGGIVCSPLEIETLRREIGREMLLVVPGIRPLIADKGDQKRTMTPAEAAKLGADYLVIGRPITQASDPRAAALEILQTI